MDSSSKSSFFPPTRWTVVRRMGDGRREVKLQGWDEFSTAYWPTLVLWLEHQGVTSPDAQDLVQGFFAKLWSRNEFTAQLSPDGGKLRSFLLRSLRNWQTDQRRYANCEKRGGQSPQVELDESLSQSEEELFYDQSWARATLRRACLDLRADYEARGHRSLFDQGLGLLDSRSPAESRRVAEELGLSSNTLNVSLKRLRERLAQRLREEVASTLVEPSCAQIDAELRHLLAAFGKESSLVELMIQPSLPR